MGFPTLHLKTLGQEGFVAICIAFYHSNSRGVLWELNPIEAYNILIFSSNFLRREGILLWFLDFLDYIYHVIMLASTVSMNSLVFYSIPCRIGKLKGIICSFSKWMFCVLSIHMGRYNHWAGGLESLVLLLYNLVKSNMLCVRSTC
jgi:hypothetical protein